jgi:hypothetical protein
MTTTEENDNQPRVMSFVPGIYTVDDTGSVHDRRDTAAMKVAIRVPFKARPQVDLIAILREEVARAVQSVKDGSSEEANVLDTWRFPPTYGRTIDDLAAFFAPSAYHLRAPALTETQITLSPNIAHAIYRDCNIHFSVGTTTYRWNKNVAFEKKLHGNYHEMEATLHNAWSREPSLKFLINLDKGIFTGALAHPLPFDKDGPYFHVRNFIATVEFTVLDARY